MLPVNIDMNNFEMEVVHSDRPVLLDFWAPRCGHCRAIMPHLDAISGERSDIKVAKINVDDYPELAGRFAVRSLPTLMLINDGKIVNKSVGAKPKAAILSMLQ